MKLLKNKPRSNHSGFRKQSKGEAFNTNPEPPDIAG